MSQLREKTLEAREAMDLLIKTGLAKLAQGHTTFPLDGPQGLLELMEKKFLPVVLAWEEHLEASRHLMAGEIDDLDIDEMIAHADQNPGEAVEILEVMGEKYKILKGRFTDLEEQAEVLYVEKDMFGAKVGYTLLIDCVTYRGNGLFPVYAVEDVLKAAEPPKGFDGLPKMQWDEWVASRMDAIGPGCFIMADSRIHQHVLQYLMVYSDRILKGVGR